MTARLMVCVFLLGTSGFSCAVIGAEPIPSDAQHSVVAAGYSIAEDDLDGRVTPESLEPNDDSSTSSGEIGYDVSCSLGGCPEVDNLWTEEDFFHVGQFFMRGWLDQGYTWNPSTPANRFNTPVTFNDRANEYEMNQLYLSMGRHVNADGCTWDWGGQIDLLYGTDYFFTTATGLETYSSGWQHWNSHNGPRAGGTAALYGLAMPQLYAEFYLPWRYGTTVKIGHFNTIMGYESVAAPKNFFYSHAYTMQYGEPFTHTGFLTSYQYGPRFTIHAGMTRGWDSWEDSTDRPAFLGGISWTSLDGRTNANFTVHSGDEHIRGENNRTSYTLVVMHQFNARWNYVFQHDLGAQNSGAINAQFNVEPAHWYGINQYLFYNVSDATSLGLRLEWFRDEENSRVLANPIASAVQGSNYYEATVGLNWHPSPRFTFRPELRWDWSDVVPRGTGGMYNDFLDRNQFTLAADLIFLF
ncbi:MAG: porin [Pirellulales bacterium]|nr:porin [Pirellulales bacterium]